MNPFERGQYPSDLAKTQHHRETLSPLRANHSVDVAQRPIENVLEKKDERVKCLILRRRRHPALERQVTQELTDLTLAKLLRMPFSMKENESLDPMDVGLLCPVAVVADAHRLSH